MDYRGASRPTVALMKTPTHHSPTFSLGHVPPFTLGVTCRNDIALVVEPDTLLGPRLTFIK